MAEKQIWIGSVGPFLYDDTDVYPDDPLLNLKGVRVDGPIKVDTPPAADEEVMRKVDTDARMFVPISVSDIDNPTELGSYGGDAGASMICYEVEAAANQITLYEWDNANSAGADSPYVVAGSSGYWVAVAGKYTAGDRNIRGSLTLDSANEAFGTATVNDLGALTSSQESTADASDLSSCITLANSLKANYNKLQTDVSNMRTKLNDLLNELRETNGCGVLSG